MPPQSPDQMDLKFLDGAVPIISPNCADIAPPSVECKRFPDGESYCRLERIEGLTGRDVVILHRLFPDPDQNLVILLQMMYGARENGVRDIYLIIPYLPYARADKAWLSGEVVSARLLVRLLQISGAKRIFTWDCHFVKKFGTYEYENVPITNLCMGPELVEFLRAARPESAVVSPDAGAKYLVGENGLFMRKERGAYAGGDEAFRPVAKMDADFEVTGQHIILVDDMIAGGGTMVKATQKMMEMGARSVSCAATHGLFLHGALDKLHTAGVTRIITSDTIPNAAALISIRGHVEKILRATGHFEPDTPRVSGT